MTLTRRDRRTVGTMLRQVERPVSVHLYLDGTEPSRNTEAIWTETAHLAHGRVRLTKHRVGETANEAGVVEQVPAAVFFDADGVDRGTRFIGVPGGYLYQTVIDHLILLGGTAPPLGEDWIALLKSVHEPLQLRVWAVANCPHCPHAIRIAERIAAACPRWVLAEVLDGATAAGPDDVPALLPTVEIRRAGSTRRTLTGVVPERAWMEAVSELLAVPRR